ncbi:MAG TPA: tetratricopeptide repeat protein, partial [Candidatus Acidoferrales bacterium]|nr:tetratricopeptide repeat protein [Candidatus Acidoferrales bacterium]
TAADLSRALDIEQALYGPDDPHLLNPLLGLCSVYDALGKPEKTEPCDRQIIAIVDKLSGANDPGLAPMLAFVLTREAKTLRSLGRPDEAAPAEKRKDAIQAAMQPSQ